VTARPPLRIAFGVALVAAVTLALQVILTRVFAAVLFYHFGFLAISLALLGVGGGAILIYTLPAWFERRDTETTLAGWCAALGVSLVVVPALLVRLHFPVFDFVTSKFALMLGAACLLCFIPFLTAGVVIALAVRRYVSWIGPLYAFDLAGAAIGALASVPLLWAAPAPVLVVALGAAAGCATLLFAGPRSRLGAVGAALAGAAIVLAIVGNGGAIYFLRPPQTDGGPRVSDRWTPLSRVIGHAPGAGVGAFLTYDRDNAPVPSFRRGGPLPTWRELALGPQSIGYTLTGPGDALVIGGGGGRDIFNALSSDQRRVDVIELNRAIRTTVDQDLRRWSGSPYTLPRVHSVIGDGRSTLAERETKYDQIHIGFTNTLSGNAANSFALTENNLYTVEAFDEYFDHLRRRGILNISRLYRLDGEEALRATVLMLAALDHRGVRDPARHVVVVLGKGVGGLFGTVLARPDAPFSAAELAGIRRLGRQRGLGVVFAPGGPYGLEWARLAAAGGWHAFCKSYPLKVCPSTDNSPFFLNMTRLSHVTSKEGYSFRPNPFQILLIVLGVLAALSLLAFVVPLALIRRTERPGASSLAFFAAIGVGFITLEVVLIQRFVLLLGFPTYSLSVVLFGLLLFTGLGSLASTRFTDPRRTLTIALATACALIAACAFALEPLIHALIGLPFAARLAATVAVLAPFGLTLGMAMPIGLRRLDGLHPTGAPWAWGLNGTSSVLASVLAIAVAINWGFEAATILALACYLVALVHAIAGRWPSGRAPSESEAPTRQPEGVPA
jgi:hypothetical protein